MIVLLLSSWYTNAGLKNSLSVRVHTNTLKICILNSFLNSSVKFAIYLKIRLIAIDVSKKTFEKSRVKISQEAEGVIMSNLRHFIFMRQNS